MGMDVFGRKNPDAYFRNNVWWWRPLWNYCIDVAPDLCEKVSGHYNDGDGLDEDDALELARRLRVELEAGRVAEYERKYNAHLASLPRHECQFCGGTGIRTDEVGVNMGMPTRALEEHIAIVVGRTHGWCNACQGEGRVDDSMADYPFSEENVSNFVDFLDDSGGFSIC